MSKIKKAIKKSSFKYFQQKTNKSELIFAFNNNCIIENILQIQDLERL